MFLDKFLIKYFADYVGSDQYGNKYYLSKTKDYLGRRKRKVIYHGLDEPTKVPPMWHGWLHYLSDEVPSSEDLKLHKWQKQHVPNLTGTKNAYKPERVKVSADYKPWHPSD